jgi:hypothetical protein
VLNGQSENNSKLTDYHKTVRKKCLPWLISSIFILFSILPFIFIEDNLARSTKIIICAIWTLGGMITAVTGIVQILRVKKKFGLVCPHCSNYLSSKCLNKNNRNLNCEICGTKLSQDS